MAKKGDYSCFDLLEARDRQFLERLAEDDELRSELESDPHRVLSEHGFDFDPESVPEKGKLPSKEEIRSQLARHDRGEGEGPQDIFNHLHFLRQGT